MSVGFFDRFSNLVSHGAGKAGTFVAACGLVVAWAVSGPFFNYSETWQLVVNTATTIITFLMVFVLQHSQNRDGEAVQAKLDDLIVSIQQADNRLVGAEQLDAHELHQLRKVIAAHVAHDQQTLEQLDERTEELVEDTQGRPEAGKPRQ